MRNQWLNCWCLDLTAVLLNLQALNFLCLGNPANTPGMWQASVLQVAQRLLPGCRELNEPLIFVVRHGKLTTEELPTL